MRRLLYFIRRRHIEQDLADEIEFHRALKQEELERSGLSRAEAAVASRRALGNVLLAREDARAVWISPWMEQVWQDVSYGARMLRKSRGFTFVAVLALALGIGGAAAVLALVNAVFLKRLPVAAPEELVWFGRPSFSYPIFKEVQSRSSEIFTASFAWTVERTNVKWSDGVEQAQTLFVSGEFYATLGVSTILGRTLTPQDDVPGRESIAVISYDTWQRRFARDPGIVGKKITIEREPVTIIGVTPAAFFGVSPGSAPDFTLPLTAYPRLTPEEGILESPGRAWLHLMARLKPGMLRAQANAALQIFWPRIMDAVTPTSMPAQRRARFLGRQTELMPGETGESPLRREFSQALLLLSGFVGLLLLVACATVAHLLLVRASVRQREMTVRAALGASRLRLLRQLVTEGMLLAALGTGAAIVPAQAGASMMVAMLQTKENPVALDLSVDWTVAAFTVIAACLAAVLFTLAPILHTSRRLGSLQESARTIVQGTHRWRLGKALIVLQVALAAVLVAGAALFARSLYRIVSLDPGFDSSRLLLVNVEPLGAGYRAARLTEYYRALLQRMDSLPGVESVSLSWVPPISNENGAWTESIAVDGAEVPVAGNDPAFFNVISSGYFATLGQMLVRGRDFGSHDMEGGVRTCIISESLARDFFPNQDPIGRRLSVGRDAARQNLEVVGLVRDAKYQRLQESFRRVAYLPFSQQQEFVGRNNLMAEVRTSGPPAGAISLIRAELAALDPAVPARFETQVERIRESLVAERAIAAISVFLGSVALVLATAGLYGLLAYIVSRRSNEIGIRMALGAQRGHIRWTVFRDSFTLCIAGTLIGIGAALLMSRFASSLIYGISPRDALALGGASLVMLLVGLAAGYLPARRATRTDPMVALRYD
jgi:predicted permease